MIRTQVQLTDEQAAALRRLAHERGVSLAALIREAVERQIAAADDPWERAARAVGAFSSGKTDVSEEHDRYLADAFGP